MNKSLCCTNCGELVVKSVGDSIKVRSKVIVFDEHNGAVAICKGCNTEIPVPIRFDDTLIKSTMSSDKLRLYVRK